MNSALLRHFKPNSELARRNFEDFIRQVMPTYDIRYFHKHIISRLQAFERGEIKKLMVFMPPQHGKSQLTSRLFPAYLLGKNPKRKIVISSYSATIAEEFARDAKNFINSPEYRQIFPNTVIGRLKDNDGSYSDTSSYYHTAPHKGFIYAVGVGGPLTSKSVDIGIIDDPFKDKEEAMSLNIREKRWSWFVDVFRTRQHNFSQELLIQTRWDRDDLGGRILAKEKDWEVIIFPAIKTKDYSPYDHRQEGEALWEEKHSRERILEQKAKSEATFNALYQQDPKPNENVLVHPNFIAVDKFPLESITKWIIGLDYGYTNDPTAVMAIGVWGNKRYWRRLIYQKESSGNRAMVNVSAQQIYDVLQKEGMLKCAMYSEHDPDMGSQLRRLGLPVKPANKSVYAGIQRVNKCENYYLADDKILHDEIINYQFQTIGEIILNDPVDGNDHCFIGSTMIETLTGQKPIKDINAGEFVLTSQGYKRVLKKWNNGVKNVARYAIYTNNFSIFITCTPDHLIKTSNGWKQISTLQPTDEIYLLNTLTAENTPYTLTSVISPVPTEECTLMYGNSIMEQSPKVAMYTTKTRIRTTTILPTWNLKKVNGTWQSMAKSGQKKSRNLLSKCKMLAKINAMHGTNQKMAGDGIRNMRKRIISAIKLLKEETAWFATPILSLKPQQQSFAPMLASPNTGEITTPILSKESAQTVAAPSQQTNSKMANTVVKSAVVRIVGIEEKPQQVYDLTVEDRHEYFANGILVHNCMNAGRYAIYSDDPLGE